MLLRSNVICPHCQSSNCRKSRRHADEKIQDLEVDRLYRCLDCSHRFLAPQRVITRWPRVVSLPVALVAIVLAVFVTLWLTRPEPLAAQASFGTGTLAVYDPEIKKAAEGGDPGAQFTLGEALLQDPARSVETSQQAYRWLQMAAENGNTEAMIVLGRLSRTGVGFLQNFGHASKWIQTAAERGSPEGMLELGRLYRDGIGVDKSLVNAYVWFNRASAARNLDAVHERELIARILTAEELKEAQHQSTLR